MFSLLISVTILIVACIVLPDIIRGLVSITKRVVQKISNDKESFSPSSFVPTESVVVENETADSDATGSIPEPSLSFTEDSIIGILEFLSVPTAVNIIKQSASLKKAVSALNTAVSVKSTSRKK